MTQLTFGDAEYVGKRKRTKREKFLAEMEQVTPWAALLARIEPAYPKAGRGRRPYLRQTWTPMISTIPPTQLVFNRAGSLSGRRRVASINGAAVRAWRTHAFRPNGIAHMGRPRDRWSCLREDQRVFQWLACSNRRAAPMPWEIWEIWEIWVRLALLQRILQRNVSLTPIFAPDFHDLTLFVRPRPIMCFA